MNNFLYIIVVLVLFASCNSEDANDCFQTSGRIVLEEVELPLFSKIRVNQDISLVLKQEAIQQVMIETGVNLLNDIEITVTDDLLTITNHNSCNFVRDYNNTTVYVSVPNLDELISSTQYQITSDGLLNLDELRITSEDYYDSSVVALGEVFLQINAHKIEVLGNNKTSFTLEGSTENLHITIADGDGICNTRNLTATRAHVYHRGSNQITVNPTQELSAELRSTGDLIVVNNPPILNVETYYTGEVIYE